MKIQEWLTKTYEETPYSGFVRPRLACADGFTISVQASGYHYSTPRKNFQDGRMYTALELGFASMDDELIEDYSDGTVYPYVPVEIVDKLIKKHGGIVE